MLATQNIEVGSKVCRGNRNRNRIAIAAVTWRLPKVEETQYLNLYKQAEKEMTTASGRRVRPGLYRGPVLVGEAATVDCSEDPKQGKVRGRSVGNVQIPSHATNVPEQGRSW